MWKMEISKFYSKQIGWLGIAMNALCLYLFYGIEDYFLAFATVYTLVINIIASVVWLLGIAMNKPSFMAIALICWGTQLCVWIFFIVILAVPGLIFGNQWTRETVFSILSVGFFLIKYYAIKSYQKLKEIIIRKRWNVPHSDSQ